MVKASSRTVHHAFAKYLDLAHSGQKVVITKRGKAWATLAPAGRGEKKKKLDWNKLFARLKADSKGHKSNVVAGMLRERALERR
jgi:antitoxin (DNA-binding transcriptional repressor) of toxin-antitoxin stability system